jgi:hypothetical protein
MKTPKPPTDAQLNQFEEGPGSWPPRLKAGERIVYALCGAYVIGALALVTSDPESTAYVHPKTAEASPASKCAAAETQGFNITLPSEVEANFIDDSQPDKVSADNPLTLDSSAIPEGVIGSDGRSFRVEQIIPKSGELAITGCFR